MNSRLLGSILIVTGTAIGAGMLAIPIVTAELGFLLSTLLLLVSWAVMTLTAFLILHVNLAFPERANFSSMAARTIGRGGQILTWLSFLLLLYSLTAAYMTGGASLLGNTLNKFGGIQSSSHMNSLVFTLVLGAFVYFGTRSVDYANRLLISLKAIAFVLMMIFLLPHVTISNLLVHPNPHLLWLKALPILITSFGFHIVIPNLRDYLGSDVKKLKQAVFVGSLIPLFIYLLWEIVILGIIPLEGPQGFSTLLLNGGGLSDMINQLSAALNKPILGFIVNFFTDVAITTSFLGVSMGLLHFIRDGLSLNRGRPGEKLIGSLITFLPPLCFAWFYPQGFVLALNYASIFVVVLLILIPVWMYYQLARQKLNSTYSFHINTLVALALVLFSIIVIGAEFLIH